MFDKRHAALVAEKEELEAALSSAGIDDSAVAVAMQFRNDITTGLANATFDDQRRVLQLLGVKVSVNDKIATVSLRLSKQSVSIELGISRLPWPPYTQTQHW